MLKVSKQVVEHTRFISINDVKELEADSVYTLTWHDDEAINIERRTDHVTLRYLLKGESVNVHVELDTTNVGYGVRSWLCCPDCGSRTAKLYNVSGIFSCRGCHDLTYLTSRKSGNRLEYLALEIRRLQHKLGIDTSDINCDMQEQPIFKPKYMHQRIWDIQRQRLGIIQLHWLDEWLKFAR